MNELSIAVLLQLEKLKNLQSRLISEPNLSLMDKPHLYLISDDIMSAVSTSIDLIEALEDSRKNTLQIRNIDVKKYVGEDLICVKEPADEITKKRKDLMNKFSGADSLLVQYLSNRVINGGKGCIEESETTIQYSSDIFTTPVVVLNIWPSGFYLNRETKAIQLLIKTDNFIICFDGLPGTFPTTAVVRKPVSYKSMLSDVNSLFVEVIEQLAVELEVSLKEIHNRTVMDSEV